MQPHETVWFWAKLGTETWPERYHPVICHLIDVGQVALALWQHSLRAPMRRRIATRLGLEANEYAAGQWIAFWVGAHDIGKVTPCFQDLQDRRTAAVKVRLEERGFKFGVGSKHHSDTGTKILFDELIADGHHWPKLENEPARKIAVAVGGHHGTFRMTWDQCTANELGNERWAKARHEILGELALLFQIANLPIPSLVGDGGQSVWMVLAGLTSVADWIGSNVTFFEPFVSRDEGRPLRNSFDADDYFTKSGENANRALNELGWLGRPSPTGQAVSFEEATGIATLRPLQEAIIPLARNTTEPQLIIVEAPMGEGKTEAAWYVARCWDDRGGAGTYVALPTMATSNQMFGRVEKFLEAQAEKSNLQLLHGKASLNDRFAKLKYAAWVYDEEKRPAAVVAEEWFAKDKRQALLAPFGVGTIDQVLLAVLQTKHVFVRLFGLAGKCVILDEVHAYDAYMTTLMERLLRWLAALGCPFVLLSATLPREKRLALIRAYAGTDAPEHEQKDYPRITTVGVGHSEALVTPLGADVKRAKKIHLNWVEDRDLVGNVIKSLANGWCAAVIRNTVGLAQKTFTKLRDALKGTDIEVELFHARFPFGRRQQIEDAVLKRFGKDGGPEQRRKRILVASQVIEQSLDLDFDVMFSDVAPVDLAFQRAGRLHRHERGDRGAAELWLIEPEEKDESGVPKFGDSEFVYARFVLLKSFLALKDRKGKPIDLPGELERLVEQVYGNETLATDNTYAAVLEESKQELLEEQRGQRHKAKGVMIYKPDAEDLLEQQSAQLQEDDPEAHKKIQAATRDTEPTIQLILVYRRDGCDFLDRACTDRFDPIRIPDVPRLRRLLANEVTISHRGCVLHYANQPVPVGWQRCGMLRYHRLASLDADGQALEGFPLRYEEELGIAFKTFLSIP